MKNYYVPVLRKCRRKNLNQFDISFMRVRSNKLNKEFGIENEKEMKDVIVDVSYEGQDRVVALMFMDCEDENYIHIKQSINEVKDDAATDYETKENSYIFHLEFDSSKEISCGGDVSVSKNRCYVDENNNSIVFVC